jgi:hypothetical protein
MKYFKIIDTTVEDEEFYISSTLPNDTPEHILEITNLDPAQYQIVEVSKEEFERETDDEAWDNFPGSEEDYDD